MPEESYKIFISYEREDAGGWAGSIYQRLKDDYGPGIVFKDEEETRTATDWPPRLARLVKSCNAVVLIIGPGWKDSRVIAKLNDPINWVHREIVTAIEADKPIFPVVIEGASVPTEGIPNKIVQALNRHHFRFRTNSNLWSDDLARLCKDIEKETGVPWSGLPKVKPVSFDHVLCRLDRNKHVGSAQLGWSTDKHRLFLAHGGKRAGFYYFAWRCALDVVRKHPQDSPEVTSLNWGLFSEQQDFPARRTQLMKDVAASVFLDSQAEDEEVLRSLLTKRIQKNARSRVVYSTVLQGTGDEEARIQEWFAVWRDLLTEDRARTIAVMLFVQSGWWPWAAADVQRVDCGGCVVGHKMDKISQTHLNEWLGADVQRLGDERLRRHLAVAGERLYRFRWGRHFDDISEAMQEAMQDSARMDSTAGLT